MRAKTCVSRKYCGIHDSAELFARVERLPLGTDAESVQSDRLGQVVVNREFSSATPEGV